MKSLSMIAFAGILICVVSPAAAEYNCTKGGEQVTVASVMNLLSSTPIPPDSTNIVNVWASTRRSQEDENNCVGWLRVEGWIDGGDGVVVKQGEHQIAQIGGQSNTMELSKLFPHVCGETHNGHTKHWWIKDGWFSNPWTSIEDRDPSVTVPSCPPPPPPDDPPPGDDPPDDGGPGCSSSPLLFDLDGDGFHLTNAAEGVQFDLDADGILDRVAWTRADSGDAWLAFDRNGNGRIDDGSELLGNRTPAYTDRAGVTAKNGFEALKLMENPSYGPSRADGQIDSRDAIFSRLLLWTDTNHNGISEPDELRSASAAGLVSVSTIYREQKRRDEHGNEFRQKGASQLLNGEGNVLTAVVWDVWLQIAR